MNPEPAGPVLPGVAAAAAANPNPQLNAADFRVAMLEKAGRQSRFTNCRSIASFGRQLNRFGRSPSQRLRKPARHLAGPGRFSLIRLRRHSTQAPA